MAQKTIHVNDAEPAQDWINDLAREAPEGELYPPEYDHDDVEGLARQVGEAFHAYDHDGEPEHFLARRRQELDATTLSEREAEVVALKEWGLTHDGIALFWALTDGPSRSAADEYSARARRKFERAQRTVEELAGLYGD